MLEIVASVGNDGERAVRQHMGEAQRKFCAADSAREGEDGTVLLAGILG